ncbi:malonyl-ACP O-methyltransferase BioC [Candidatus Methylocalor cossyra]|uniref:Malonyl-[acyl-carrier protein] O-methyltransferase n=1 Tax=Candidatus Methylocalor cossyra TaxID=3108543 RepID=A0ABM9NFS2_9GAMM
MPARECPPGEARPDKAWVRRSFGAAADRYDGVAHLQRAVGERLCSWLATRLPAPGVWVDVGAGTGRLTQQLCDRHGPAHLFALDLAEAMLRVARERLGRERASYLCGDAEALPFADRSVDLVFSNLTLQWCPDPTRALREFRRVLRPDGVALFSTLGPDTLRELRCAWAAVDARSHVNTFIDGATLTAAARNAAGFAEVALDSETRILAYPDVYALMRELKALGARNVTTGRARHLTGKKAFKAMVAAYPRSPGGGIGASFQVLYAMAWGGKPP